MENNYIKEKIDEIITRLDLLTLMLVKEFSCGITYKKEENAEANEQDS